MLNFLLFLALNALVLAGAALVVRFGLNMRDRLAIVLASATLGWVTIVVGLEMLGLFGQIRLVPAVALATGVFVIGLIVRYMSRWRSVPDAGHSAVITDFVANSARSTPTNSIARWALVAIAAMTVWATLDVLIGSLCSPVLPISDAPIYHLYFPVRWWQSGRLDIVPTPFGESAAPYFPANANVWFTWLLLPWSSELAAKVGQWPFLWLGMAAVFGLTCQLGVKRHWACLPAALWGTGTLPILNSGFADVDLVLAAWYLISTWFLVRYARGYKPGDLVCGALAMGAALGTKYIAILFVPALLLFAGIAIGRSEQRWSHGLLLVVGVTLPAAFWYVRNALLTGNPLYPLHQEVLGFPILRGWYRREALFSSEYHIPVTNWSALLLLLLRGMDPILVPFWLTGLVAAVCAAWRNRLLPILLVAIALLHLTVFWAINPYQTQDRFLFAAFALLAIPVALQFERVPLLSVPFAGLLGWHLVVGPQSLVEWIRAVMGIDSSRLFWPPLLPAPLHIVAESWSATLSNRVIVGRFALLVAIMVAAAIGSVAFRPTNRRVAWAIASGVVALAGIGFRAYYSWVPEDYSRFRFIPYAPQIGYTPGWLILDELSRRPLRVAYAGTNLPFYLFGSRLQNDVHYVNINGHGPFLMHDYHKLFMAHGEFLARSSTPDWDRREADEMAWLQNLRDQRINLLFLGFVNRAGGAHNFYDRDGFPIERTWADRHPEIFHPIHTDARTRLYAVRFQADPAPERP